LTFLKTTQQLEQVKGRKPTDEELAQVLNISPQQLEKIQAASTRTITRLETPLGEDKDSELANFIPDQSSPLPEKVVVHDLVTERLEEVLATLDPREERILRLRFGLNGEQRPYTLEEVGEMLGLTRERVRQIQNEALRHLRHPRRARLLKDFYDGR